MFRSRTTKPVRQPMPGESLGPLLDRWVSALGELGISNPHSLDAPSSITLTGPDGERVLLSRPERNIGHRDYRHPVLHYGGNAVLATQVVDGTSNTLHVTSDQQPYVLASQGGELTSSNVTAEGIMSICLTGQVERPAS